MKSLENNELNYITHPYTSEFVYSTIARYQRNMNINSGIANLIILQDQYTIDNRKSRFTVIKINQLAQSFGGHYTCDNIIDNHTTFRYDTAFYFPKRKEIVKDAYINGGNKFDHFQRQHIRFCPVCQLRNEQQIGESFFQVEHQLDGILACPICHTPLLNYHMDDYYNYICFDSAKVIIEKNIKITPEHIELADMAGEIINSKHDFLGERKEIRNRLMTLLREKGLIYNKVISKDFIVEIKNKYMLDNTTASYYGFDIDSICDEIPKTLTLNDQKRSRTITFLILIHFLAGSLKRFNDTIPYRRTKIWKNHRFDSDDLIMKYKGLVEELITSQSITRTELRKNYKTAYVYLMAADREWLDVMLPPGERPKKEYDVMHDKEIRNKIEQTRSELLKNGMRVCKANLQKNEEIRTKVLNCGNLPITKEYIGSIVESPKQFMRRKIENTIDDLVLRKEDFTYHKIMKQSNISLSNFNNVKEMTDDYLAKIGHKTINLRTGTKEQNKR